MKNSLKIFVACAAGALIGALTALQLKGWWWLLGMPIGALGGYLFYEGKKVIEAIPKAFKASFAMRRNVPKVAKKIVQEVGFRPFLLLALAVWLIVSLHIKDSVTMITANVVFLWLFLLFLAVSFLTMLFSFFSFIFVCVSGDEKMVNFFGEPLSGFEKFSRSQFLVFLKDICLGVVKSLWGIIKIPWYLVRGLWWLAKVLFLHLPKATGKFVWTVFKLIHSDIRVLCTVDAALGAAVGYFAGSAIIGAAAGGLLGVVSYALVAALLRHFGLIPNQVEN